MSGFWWLMIGWIAGGGVSFLFFCCLQSANDARRDDVPDEKRK